MWIRRKTAVGNRGVKPMRSHPINILENTSRFLILLLFPLISGLWRSRNGFSAWLAGAWFDLLVIGVILAIGIYGWVAYTFSITEAGIYINRGIFLKKERFLPYCHMTAVAVEAPWYFLPFRAVRLKADTDAGSPKRADFTITVRTSLSDEILVRSKKPFLTEDNTCKTYIPRNFYIIVFSLLTSNSITGIIYLYATFTQAGNILGRDISDRLMATFTELAVLISFGLPPVFAMIAYIIAGCWLVSFLLNLLRHLRFRARRRGGIIDIRSGIFTVRHFSITVKRINYVNLRQSLLSRMLGFMSVFIHCTGYGKEKTELSVLLPAGMRKEIRGRLKDILPEIPFAKKDIRPKLVNISRFLIPPATLILCVFAGVMLLRHYVTGFQNIIFFLLVILEIPCIWWLMVKLYAYFFTGIGIDRDVLTIYYTRGYSIVTSSIPLDKITKIETSQSLFQLSSKCCDVQIYTNAEGIKRQKIQNLHLPEVRDLLDPRRNPFLSVEEESPKRKR